MDYMHHRQSSPGPRPASPRRSMQRQRSNSFPIIEALGCTTPEARLILAESRAAVRKRRRRRNQSVEEATRAFNPREHLHFLQQLAAVPTPHDRPAPFGEVRHVHSHSRMPSDATDRSTTTVVAHDQGGPVRNPSPTLGDYSANLAQFIKQQLQSIPTYQPGPDASSPLSPRSCPDLSYAAQASHVSCSTIRRPVEKPGLIDIPPIRAPLKSQFSAWSSTDDDTDDESIAFSHHRLSLDKDSQNGSSFLFSSTPIEQEPEPATAKQFTFPHQSALPSPSSAQPDYDDYPSSHLSQPQLTSLSATSAPSFSSSSASSSYFDCKRPTAITPQMKERVIAAVTPPHIRTKRTTALSPWEAAALANAHDVYVESHQRVHVDGMSFDMLRDYNVSNTRLTPC
ncbi:hypothetical protein ACJQWK_11219 [Exserohilum turcicum]